MYKLIVKDLTRVNNDVNGNPRYVFHFLALADDNDSINTRYNNAIAVAKKLIGGKKFHNKQYGGGIVFQSYNVQNDLDILNAYIEENSK